MVTKQAADQADWEAARQHAKNIDGIRAHQAAARGIRAHEASIRKALTERRSNVRFYIIGAVALVGAFLLGAGYAFAEPVRDITASVTLERVRDDGKTASKSKSWTMPALNAARQAATCDRFYGPEWLGKIVSGNAPHGWTVTEARCG